MIAMNGNLAHRRRFVKSRLVAIVAAALVFAASGILFFSVAFGWASRTRWRDRCGNW
jgi:hypothetical protein